MDILRYIRQNIIGYREYKITVVYGDWTDGGKDVLTYGVVVEAFTLGLAFAEAIKHTCRGSTGYLSVSCSLTTDDDFKIK